MTDQIGLMLSTPAEPPNGEYKFHDYGGLRGKQLRARYSNGYGASVIQGPHSYGGPEGLYEVAVTHGGSVEEYDSLCYSTSVTSDVIGYCSPERVVEILHAIAHLPANDGCGHDSPPWDGWVADGVPGSPLERSITALGNFLERVGREAE